MQSPLKHSLFDTNNYFVQSCAETINSPDFTRPKAEIHTHTHRTEIRTIGIANNNIDLSNDASKSKQKAKKKKNSYNNCNKQKAKIIINLANNFEQKVQIT